MNVFQGAILRKNKSDSTEFDINKAENKADNKAENKPDNKAGKKYINNSQNDDNSSLFNGDEFSSAAYQADNDESLAMKKSPVTRRRAKRSGIEEQQKNDNNDNNNNMRRHRKKTTRRKMKRSPVRRPVRSPIQSLRERKTIQGLREKGKEVAKRVLLPFTSNSDIEEDDDEESRDAVVKNVIRKRKDGKLVIRKRNGKLIRISQLLTIRGRRNKQRLAASGYDNFESRQFTYRGGDETLRNCDDTIYLKPMIEDHMTLRVCPLGPSFLQVSYDDMKDVYYNSEDDSNDDDDDEDYLYEIIEATDSNREPTERHSNIFKNKKEGSDDDDDDIYLYPEEEDEEKREKIIRSLRKSVYINELRKTQQAEDHHHLREEEEEEGFFDYIYYNNDDEKETNLFFHILEEPEVEYERHAAATIIANAWKRTRGGGGNAYIKKKNTNTLMDRRKKRFRHDRIISEKSLRASLGFLKQQYSNDKYTKNVADQVLIDLFKEKKKAIDTHHDNDGNNDNTDELSLEYHWNMIKGGAYNRKNARVQRRHQEDNEKVEGENKYRRRRKSNESITSVCRRKSNESITSVRRRNSNESIISVLRRKSNESIISVGNYQTTSTNYSNDNVKNNNPIYLEAVSKFPQYFTASKQQQQQGDGHNDDVDEKATSNATTKLDANTPSQEITATKMIYNDKSSILEEAIAIAEILDDVCNNGGNNIDDDYGDNGKSNIDNNDNEGKDNNILSNFRSKKKTIKHFINEPSLSTIMSDDVSALKDDSTIENNKDEGSMIISVSNYDEDMNIQYKIVL